MSADDQIEKLERDIKENAGVGCLAGAAGGAGGGAPGMAVGCVLGAASAATATVLNARSQQDYEDKQREQDLQRQIYMNRTRR